MTSVFDVVRLQSTKVLQSRKQPAIPQKEWLWRDLGCFSESVLCFHNHAFPLFFGETVDRRQGKGKVCLDIMLPCGTCLLSLPNLHTAGISCSSWSKSPCWVRGCVCVSVGASRTSKPSLSLPLESDLWFLPILFSAWGKVVNTVEHRVTLKWASSRIKRTWQEWRWRSLSLVL